jgi:hypothetical protein
VAPPPRVVMSVLNEAATRVGVAGARYNDAMQKLTGL